MYAKIHNYAHWLLTSPFNSHCLTLASALQLSENSMLCSCWRLVNSRHSISDYIVILSCYEIVKRKMWPLCALWFLLIWPSWKLNITASLLCGRISHPLCTGENQGRIKGHEMQNIQILWMTLKPIRNKSFKWILICSYSNIPNGCVKSLCYFYLCFYSSQMNINN